VTTRNSSEQIFRDVVKQASDHTNVINVLAIFKGPRYCGGIRTAVSASKMPITTNSYSDSLLTHSCPHCQLKFKQQRYLADHLAKDRCKKTSLTTATAANSSSPAPCRALQPPPEFFQETKPLHWDEDWISPMSIGFESPSQLQTMPTIPLSWDEGWFPTDADRVSCIPTEPLSWDSEWAVPKDLTQPKVRSGFHEQTYPLSGIQKTVPWGVTWDNETALSNLESFLKGVVPLQWDAEWHLR
jgi:hypothetical protein